MSGSEKRLAHEVIMDRLKDFAFMFAVNSDFHDPEADAEQAKDKVIILQGVDHLCFVLERMKLSPQDQQRVLDNLRQVVETFRHFLPEVLPRLAQAIQALEPQQEEAVAQSA